MSSMDAVFRWMWVIAAAVMAIDLVAWVPLLPRAARDNSGVTGTVHLPIDTLTGHSTSTWLWIKSTDFLEFPEEATERSIWCLDR
jgi:hypothetical protein